MEKGNQAEVSRNVHRLFQVGTVGSLTDHQLLECFTGQAADVAETAFTALVERHGPMVLHVCRSVLRDPHDAHDAFQATFMILMRRAGSLWVNDSLGPWLHQVAFRVALNSRAAAARRSKHERKAAERISLNRPDAQRDDLGAVLHEEVSRLPEGYRKAVLLCCFEGLSLEQAAQRLGCPTGTVQSRLARGRERLRSRLTRRGVAPALGMLGTELATEAASTSIPSSLVEATVRAALPISMGQTAAVAVVSPAVTQLVQGALRAMFLTKLRMAIVSIATLAALAAGAGTIFQEEAPPKPPVNLNSVRAELGAQDPANPREGFESGPVPKDLAWIPIPPAEHVRILDLLAQQSQANYEKIRTWKGAYSYILRQRLDENFVTQAFAGKYDPKGKVTALIQESDSTLKFAIDSNMPAIYRDIETSRMRFLKPGSDEEIEISNVGPDDHRSVVTPDQYLNFRPKEVSTSGFVPDLPEAQNKRRVEIFPVNEARTHDGGTLDPREFYKFGQAYHFWQSPEFESKALRGKSGAQFKKSVASGLKLSVADGPGGRWYQHEMTFGDPTGQSTLTATSIWSPQAGFNPISSTTRFNGEPVGRYVSKTEWQWKVVAGIYVPSFIHEVLFDHNGKGITKDRETKLKECVLNQPLDPHQFDAVGLGLKDNEIVLNREERVVYTLKNGELIKLANFGDRSILKSAKVKLAEKPPAQPSPGKSGRIYTTANLETDDRGMPVASLIAIDPESGEVTKVAQGSPYRLRSSPDGRSLAYINFSQTNTLCVRAISGNTEPTTIFDFGPGATGSTSTWSPDGKQMIVSQGSYDDVGKRWVFKTIRINADGSGRESLPIPPEDGVQDWSSDGQWVVTASSRNAKIGWQLYVMHPDGKEVRQVTEGGNPFYVRFSPDGKRLLYTDGPKAPRKGLWVVDIDGKNRRQVLATEKQNGSGCWSPDGTRIAFALEGADPQDHGRIEIVNLDGTHHTLLTFPSQKIADSPEWK